MKVLKPGLLTTVQDIGRTGYQKYGVLASGAMDTVSLRIANLLIGNSENEAGLEITLMGPGPSFYVSKTTLIAVTGADFTLRINDEEAPLWKPVLVKENSTVSFGPCKLGSRAYLATVGFHHVSETVDEAGRKQPGASSCRQRIPQCCISKHHVLSSTPERRYVNVRSEEKIGYL